MRIILYCIYNFALPSCSLRSTAPTRRSNLFREQLSQLHPAERNLAGVVTLNVTSLFALASCRTLCRPRTYMQPMAELMREFIRRVGARIFFRKQRCAPSRYTSPSAAAWHRASLFPERTKRDRARTNLVLHIKCIRKESHVPAEADTLLARSYAILSEAHPAVYFMAVDCGARPGINSREKLMPPYWTRPDSCEDIGRHTLGGRNTFLTRNIASAHSIPIALFICVQNDFTYEEAPFIPSRNFRFSRHLNFLTSVYSEGSVQYILKH